MAGTVFNKYSGAGEMKANKCRIQPQPTQPSSCRFCIQKKKKSVLSAPPACSKAGRAAPEPSASSPRRVRSAPCWLRPGGAPAPPRPGAASTSASLRGCPPTAAGFSPFVFPKLPGLCRFLRVYSFNSSLCSVGSRASLRTALRGSLSFIRVYFCPKT